MDEKLYPFSGTKHAHDIEFRYNRLKNEMHEADLYGQGSTPEQEQMLSQLTELMGYMHEGVCYIPGSLYSLAKETAAWAEITRGSGSKEAVAGDNFANNYGEGSETLRILLVRPGEAAQVVDIEKGLKPLQAAVGGRIEAIYPFKDNVAIVCNDEGKLKELPLNRAIIGENYRTGDIISGDFLVVGLGEEDFQSLSQDQLEKYCDLYKEPDYFIETDDGITVVRGVTRDYAEPSAKDFDTKLKRAEIVAATDGAEKQSHHPDEHSKNHVER